MLLSHLAQQLDIPVIWPSDGPVNIHDPEILALTQDSRETTNLQNAIYAALPGLRFNGLDFVNEVLANGICSLILPRTAAHERKYSVPVLTSSDCRATFSCAAAILYGPALDKEQHKRIAITGTNGKTSVAHFARHLLNQCGQPAASAGTLGLMPGNLISLPTMTTAEPTSVFKAIKKVTDMGFHHFLIEASSHGLDQRRLDGLDPDIAVFTNFGQDHLDYHKDMAAYADAKFRLFASLLKPDGIIITNQDESFSQRLVNLPQRRLSYGFSPCDLQIKAVHPTSSGQELDLYLFGKRYRLETSQIGSYQALNLMASLAIALECDVPLDRALQKINSLPGVPGRMEIIAHKKNRLLIVDYAHTADGLVAALKAARQHVSGKLRLVVGAGGDRDTTKRKAMGIVAASLADVTYVTDDNPRSEDPALIRQSIIAGAKNVKHRGLLLDSGTRKAAITQALEEAEPGDVVLVAGKGHETTQEIGNEKLPFDDRKICSMLALDLW